MASITLTSENTSIQIRYKNTTIGQIPVYNLIYDGELTVGDTLELSNSINIPIPYQTRCCCYGAYVQSGNETVWRLYPSYDYTVGIIYEDSSIKVEIVENDNDSYYLTIYPAEFSSYTAADNSGCVSATTIYSNPSGLSLTPPFMSRFGPIFAIKDNTGKVVNLAYDYRGTISNIRYFTYYTYDNTFEHGSATVGGQPDTGVTTAMTISSGSALTPIFGATEVAVGSFLDDETTGDEPLQNSPDPSDHYGGGNGNFDYSSDVIDEPSPPGIKYNSLACAGVWAPTEEQLTSVMKKLWSGSVLNSLAAIFQNNSPFDAIMSLKQFPFTVTSSTTASMALGTVDMKVTVNVADAQFVTMEYTGTVRTFTGDFFDYSPFTDISIHLPFVGIMSLDTNMVIGKSIVVKYIVDVTTGNLLCAVIVDGKTLYTYQSSCGYDIPITAVDSRNQSRNIAAFTASALTTVASMGSDVTVAGATMTAVGQSIGGATEASTKPLQKSGSVGGTAGTFDSYDVYLIYKCPDVSYNTKSNPDIHGYKASGVVTLSDLKDSGYTKISYINPTIEGATQTELDEIKNIMTGSGVIL